MLAHRAFALPIPTLVPFVLVLACSDPATSGIVGDTDSGGGDGETTAAPGSSSESGSSPAVAYYEDVKPILDARCVACHREGGIAPFALDSYEDAATWAVSASSAIHAGTMPPWPPAEGCNEYVGNRELTDAQVATIDGWVATQTPIGDPAAEGPPLDDVEPGLSRVDLALAMPSEYTPQSSPDDYRCFIVDWPAEHTTTKYVTGFRAVPGNDAIVHHVIAYLATAEQREAYAELDAADEGPGYTCFGGTGGPSRAWLGGWAPGSAGSDLPEGLGLPVEPGSQVILQVHYNTLSTDPAADATSIELKIDDRVERVAKVQPFANPQWFAPQGMLIPAGEPEVVHAFEADLTNALGGSTEIWNAGLHMHLLGQRGRLSVERADGSSECLLAIDAWDFHWQGSYGLRAPVVMNPGDKLRLECQYDNSAENQPYVDGVQITPTDVRWGESTTDEMCLGIILAAPK